MPWLAWSSPGVPRDPAARGRIAWGYEQQPGLFDRYRRADGAADRRAVDHRAGGLLPVLDPATEEPIAEVASATAEDAIEAVTAAHDALPGWAATPPRVRGECLRRAYELMIADTESLAKLMVLENGKALRDARAEVTYAAEFFRWFAEEAVRIDGMVTRSPSGTNRILVTAPAGRGVRARHAVELPGRDGDPQDRARAGGRLHGGAQAGQGDPALGAGGRRHPGRGRRAGRRGQRAAHHLAWHGGRRHAGRPEGPQAVLHRIHRGRPDAAAHGGGHGHQLLDGTGRQRAVPDPGRCRRRRGGRRRDDRQDAQRR